ncbi:MAG: ABC transporter substrate-binding protein [Candidatus Cloacimonetes bacterium]|nr:ABC transporter substrate-binding protein [Candidatus Cloacimonadota bacterium]
MNIRAIPIDWSVNLLLNDAIDMMNAMVYNEYNRILMSGLREEDLVVFDLADYGFDLAEDGLYATKEFYERHKQQCHDFAAATLEGWIYAQSHKGETLDVVMRYLRENHLPANREHQAWMLDHMISKIMEDPNRVGQLELHDFDLAQKILMDRGLLANPVGYKSFFPHEN